jgi:glutathione S-transferase
LEELGLPYRLRMLPFPPRAAAPDYLAVNPLGTIPLLEDGEARMTESAAICQYLVSRYGPSPLNVAPEEPGYAAFLNGLHFGEATLTFPQTIVLRYGQLEPPERRLPQVVADYARWTVARMRAYEKMRAGAFYAAAGRFTMADISIAYAVLLARTVGIGGDVPEALSKHLDHLAERPAFARAKQAQAAAPASL